MSSTKINKKNSLILEEIDKALETAMFYGFVPIKKPRVTKEDSVLSGDCNDCIAEPEIGSEMERSHRLENKIRILRSYLDGHFQKLPSPTMVCYKETVGKQNTESVLNLLILGQLESIAEAIAIKTATSLLSQHSQNLKVEINHIGDRECFTKFEKDFFGHLKKNLDNTPGNQIQDSNINRVYRKYKENENLKGFWNSAPKPLDYLDQINIKHFREILEYLEQLGTPYDLNHFLIPNWENCHRTIFKIKDGEEVLAFGLRHQNITRKFGVRKDVPMLYVSVKDRGHKNQKLKNIKQLRPKIFLMHLGNKAKAKSLMVVDTLRRAKIPLFHALTKDQISNQLSIAESLKFSHILIIGEKEAVENSVIVRDAESRTQETVPTQTLVGHLKKMGAS